MLTLITCCCQDESWVLLCSLTFSWAITTLRCYTIRRKHDVSILLSNQGANWCHSFTQQLPNKIESSEWGHWDEEAKSIRIISQTDTCISNGNIHCNLCWVMEAIMTMEMIISLVSNWDQDKHLSYQTDKQGTESIPRNEAESQSPLGYWMAGGRVVLLHIFVVKNQICS